MIALMSFLAALFICILFYYALLGMGLGRLKKKNNTLYQWIVLILIVIPGVVSMVLSFLVAVT